MKIYRVIIVMILFIISSRAQSTKFKVTPQTNQYIPQINISTTCNIVNLATYNYSGIVRSGYLSINKENSVLGFIFYGKADQTNIKSLNDYPTIIWLSGGPGQSSQLGNFNELGPFWVTRNPIGATLKITRNKFSWTNNYNVLFIDQPVGTGLSYADPLFKDPFVRSMKDVGIDFYEALNNLYNNANGCFSANQLNIKPNSKLYIFGEDVAGKYIPAIASQIITNAEKGGFLTGLKGIGLGGALTNPYDTLSEMGSYAYHLGLIDYQQRTVVEKKLINATINYDNRRYDQLHSAFYDIKDYIIEKTGVNVYDITKAGDYDDTVNEYLHDPNILKIYNLNPEIRFGLQADQVHANLFTDFMKSEVVSLEVVLRKNLPVLIYNGQNDLFVQTPGTTKWVERLYYQNADQFRNKLFTPWKVNQKVVGSMKSAGPLEYRIINNAGHRVPMDQPESSLEMVKSFVERTK